MHLTTPQACTLLFMKSWGKQFNINCLGQFSIKDYVFVTTTKNPYYGKSLNTPECTLTNVLFEKDT